MYGESRENAEIRQHPTPLSSCIFLLPSYVLRLTEGGWAGWPDHYLPNNTGFSFHVNSGCKSRKISSRAA